MSYENIELDLQETPLIAAPIGEEVDPSVAAAQAQGIVESDAFTDPEGIKVAMVQNSDSVNDAAACEALYNKVKATGKISKLDIDAIRPSCKRTSLEGISENMFTDVPSGINAKRGQEALLNEVDAQKTALSGSITASLQKSLGYYANEFEKKLGKYVQIQADYSSAYSQFSIVHKTTAGEATAAMVGDQFVGEAGSDSTGTALVDNMVDSLRPFLATSRQVSNLVLGVANHSLFVDNLFISLSEASPPRYELISEIPNTGRPTVTLMLTIIGSTGLVHYIKKLQRTFQEAQNFLQGLHETSSNAQEISQLQVICSEMNTMVMISNGILRQLDNLTGITQVCAKYVQELSASIGVETPESGDISVSRENFLSLLK